MNASRWYLTVIAVVLCGFGAAWAQTPDGETPSEESVCDVLQEPGITPGLYGLCVAYCEAQDVTELSDQEIMCDNSGEQLLRNYLKKMKPGDPTMPCLRPDCSCFDYDDLALITLQKPDTGCWLYDCASDEWYDKKTGELIRFRTAITHKRDRALVWADYLTPKKTHCIWEYKGKRITVGISLEEAEVCREIILDSGDPECFE